MEEQLKSRLITNPREKCYCRENNSVCLCLCQWELNLELLVSQADGLLLNGTLYYPSYSLCIALEILVSILIY